MNQLGSLLQCKFVFRRAGWNSGFCFLNKLPGDAHAASSNTMFLRSKILDPPCFVFVFFILSKQENTYCGNARKRKDRNRFKEKQELPGYLISALGLITVTLTLIVEGIPLPSYPK